MNIYRKPRALIAMSGGVDSSAAALLAIRMGYECTGVTMRLFGDMPDAARAAETLGIEHRTVDFTDDFRERVVEPFVADYESGKTPNPCTTCNIRIKFGLLYEYMLAEGFDKLVTGHYARIEGSRLLRAAHAKKDQSYFLYGIPKEKLGRILFPLGELTKEEVRALAAEAGLENAHDKESQDICFVPGGDHTEFIINYRGKPSAGGSFVDTHGRVLGRHAGIERYTIGQRRGLGLAVGHPIFVKEIRPGTREVVLADEYELFVSHIMIGEVNLFAEAPERAEVMIRYNATPARATITSGPGGSLIAGFDEPVRAPAKGQAAVLYDGDLVIGGGRIEDIWH